jgi:hypothetical protein
MMNRVLTARRRNRFASRAPVPAFRLALIECFGRSIHSVAVKIA